MPKITFENLSIDKKEKLMKAAESEFCRVPFEEVSINKIIKKADISRGSFYTYFEDKNDLMLYLLKDYYYNTNKKFEEIFKIHKGNVFNVAIDMYTYIIDNYLYSFGSELFRNMFICMKVNKKMDPHEVMEKLRENKKSTKDIMRADIDRTILNYSEEYEVTLICDILIHVCKTCIVDSCIKKYDRQKSLDEFNSKLRILRKGMEKNINE